VIVCAHNEARLLPACLHSLLAQTRPADDILVINNASTDETGAVARAVPGVRVVDEPAKGLVVARETARHLLSVGPPQAAGGTGGSLITTRTQRL
jgi:glycosyltransferase involved in cell wall biosynthesis